MSSHIVIWSDGLIVINIFIPSDFLTMEHRTIELFGLSDYGTIR